MKKKSSYINILEEFINKTFLNLPSLEEQEKEVKLMNFKIRSLSGDLFKIVNFNKFGFINLLWLLGKFDEFLQEHPEIDKTEKNLMIDALLNLYNNFNKNDLLLLGTEKLEIELFKDNFVKKHKN